MFASEIREYRDFLEQQRLMFLNVTDTVVLNQQQREVDQERKEEAIRQKASGRIEVRVVCASGSCASVMQSKYQKHIILINIYSNAHHGSILDSCTCFVLST